MAQDGFVNVYDYEKYALGALPRNTADYYRSGAQNECTLRNNKAAFEKLRIKQRCLVGAADVSLKTTVLGETVDIPIGIAPSAMQKLAHPEGEIGNAKAAGTRGTAYILSTLSTTSMEELAKETPDTLKWFQLYVYNDREQTKKLVQRAEESGFKALVVTVDAPVFGIRYADKKNQFSLPANLKLGNFDAKEINTIRKEINECGLATYVDMLMDKNITWEAIEWLKSIKGNMKLVLKGIMCAEDAAEAAKLGADAILVSNHGGRQLESAPATIEVLPEIVNAVKEAGGSCEIYLDGGIMNGTDAFKAIALGAKMVFIGRPALWGLTHSGQKGVEHVLDILKNELKNTMALAGCKSLDTIPKNTVLHEDYYTQLALGFEKTFITRMIVDNLHSYK